MTTAIREFRALFALMWRHSKRYFLYVLLLILAQNVLSFSGVLLPKYLLDALSAREVQTALWIAAGMAGFVPVCSVLISTLDAQKAHINRTLRVDLHTRLVRRVTQSDYQSFESFETRERHAFAVQCLSKNAVESVIGCITGVIGSAITLVGMLYVVSYVAWWLWIVMLISVIVNTLCERWRAKYNYESYRSQNKAEMQMLYARDWMPRRGFAKEVRLFGLYDYVVTRADQYINALSALQTRRARKTFAALWVTYLFNGLYMVAAYGYIAYRCFQGEIGIGSFAMLTMAMLTVGQATQSIASGVIDAHDQMRYVRNYLQVVAAPKQDDAEPLMPDDQPFTLSLDEVSFTYPGAETPALNAVTQSFASGKKYGIVGANGSGKTTFVHLLMRLYRPDRGDIRLSLKDAAAQSAHRYKRGDWFALFSPVLQGFNAYAYTIAENIAMGRPHDPARMRRLLTELHLDERMASLPDGLDTPITAEYDDGGTDFSGGEKQKLAIARALYKDAPILVFDEPTAALSPQSEVELYHAMNRLARDKTVFFISHRLASCRMCDEILVFDEGRVVARGTHDALMSDSGGLYHRMFTAQAQLYAEEEQA